MRYELDIFIIINVHPVTIKFLLWLLCKKSCEAFHFVAKCVFKKQIIFKFYFEMFWGYPLLCNSVKRILSEDIKKFSNISEGMAAYQYMWHYTLKKMNLCRKVTGEGYIDLPKKTPNKGSQKTSKPSQSWEMSLKRRYLQSDPDNIKYNIKWYSRQPGEGYRHNN